MMRYDDEEEYMARNAREDCVVDGGNVDGDDTYEPPAMRCMLDVTGLGC